MYAMGKKKKKKKNYRFNFFMTTAFFSFFGYPNFWIFKVHVFQRLVFRHFRNV